MTEVMTVTRVMNRLESAIHAFLSDLCSWRSRQAVYGHSGWSQSSKVQHYSVTFIFMPLYTRVIDNKHAESNKPCSHHRLLRYGLSRYPKHYSWTMLGREFERQGIHINFPTAGTEWNVVQLDKYAGSIRSLLNQHRTRTISNLVLANIFKGILWHLWTCSECSNDDLLTTG